MTKIVTIAALAAILSGAAAANANAWVRNRTISGWRGTATLHAEGGCANGTCSRSITRTGPYGNSFTRHGSISCANGACSGVRTTTGPYGGTIIRRGSVQW